MTARALSDEGIRDFAVRIEDGRTSLKEECESQGVRRGALRRVLVLVYGEVRAAANQGRLGKRHVAPSSDEACGPVVDQSSRATHSRWSFRDLLRASRSRYRSRGAAS